MYKLGSLELYRFATLPKVKLILQKGAKMTFTLNHRAFVVIEKGSVSYHMLSGTKKIFGPEESHDAVLVPAYYHQQWFIREPNTCVSILFKEDFIRTMLAELAVLPN